MAKREAFLEAACEENVQEFLRFIQLHNDKTEPFDVEEVVQEMARDQRESLWGRLVLLLQDALSKLPTERSEEKKEEDMEVDSATDPKHVMAVVAGVTLVAVKSVNVLQNGDRYRALLEIVNVLHDVLSSLPISGSPVQSGIHVLFELWWKKGLEEKEKFGCTAFLISLQKSFILKKPTVEIQRVWSLHNVLLTLDDNKEITELLLQCFHRPVYIRNDDGKRFLVFLFNWNINFVCIIHSTIKNHMEFFNKSMIAHIKEIYFRAWKKASGDFVETIESTCIQDFMQCAILLHRTSPVHSKVREILSYFHSKKGCHRVDKMLYNLYKPILWKALHAPNYEVRANATLILTEAFPIHDPEDAKNIDNTVQKQLDTVMTLLDDPQPTVRSTAILGVCKILAKCWELLPPLIITDFFKKLLELASDTSSPDVRCSVFKSLTIVLDNSLSHPLLEKLLPNLKYSLHDNSEKVRSAFLDMLIKMKAVRAAKFWDVCNMDHLLARLAIDSQPVSKRIVGLLFNSFFPVNESDKEWSYRCITLSQMNPMAARKFYQFACKHTAPTNIIRLMLAIRRVLNSCIPSDDDVSDMNDSNKENSTVKRAGLGKDKAVVASLLEVVIILWRSVEDSLNQNEEARTYTIAKFGSVMSKYFCAFEDVRCTPLLIQLAAFMPPTAVPTFSCGVLSKLRRMETGAEPKQYSQLLDCLCSWGQAGEILEVINDWLFEALPKEGEKAASKRKVRIQETVEAKPDLALAYLEYMFCQTRSREKLLGLGPRPLKQLHTVLGNWKLLLFNHLSSSEEPNNPSVQTAVKAFVFHGQLCAHLQHNFPEGREYLLCLEHDAVWISERVLPFMAKQNDNERGVSDKPQTLAVQIIEGFLAVCRDVLLVSLADETFKGQTLHLCSLILLSEVGYLCIPALLRILKEVTESCPPENNETLDDQENPTTVILGVVANIFQKIIELLARHLRKEPEEGRQLCQSAVPGLTHFLQIAQIWDRKPLNGVFSTLFAAIVVEKRHKLNKITHPEEVIVPQSVDDMPPLASILLSVIIKSPSVTKAFLAEICSSLESEVIESLTELAAVFHILAVIRHTGKFKSDLKSAAVCFQQQLDKHAIVAVDGGDIQRVIYESSMKAVKDILDL